MARMMTLLPVAFSIEMLTWSPEECGHSAVGESDHSLRLLCSQTIMLVPTPDKREIISNDDTTIQPYKTKLAHILSLMWHNTLKETRIAVGRFYLET